MITLNLVDLFFSVSILLNIIAIYIYFDFKKKFKKQKTDFDNILEDIEKDNENSLKELEELAIKKEQAIHDAYKDTFDRVEKELEIYQKYILNLNSAIHLADEKLKEVDVRGTFQSDDEIGWFFKTIKEIQKILNEFKVEIQKS